MKKRDRSSTSYSSLFAGVALALSPFAFGPASNVAGQGNATIVALRHLDPAVERTGDFPTDVTNAGVVVGWSPEDERFDGATLWTATGAALGLGPDPDYPQTFAESISGSGDVVCGYTRATNGTRGEAFLWTSGSGIVRLPDFSAAPNNGVEYSEATAISGDGSVIWGVSSTAPDVTTVVRWTGSPPIPADVGTLPFGDGGNYVYDTSWNGDVAVGASANGTGLLRATFITPSGVTALPRLTSIGGLGFATGVDSSGTVVVGYQGYQPEAAPFIWRSGVGTSELPRLTLRSEASVALGVADNGVVVGRDDGSGARATLWIAERPFLLDSYLTETYDADLAGWERLSQISAISPNGRYLTGYGVRRGTIRAFLVHLTGNRAPVANAGVDLRRNLRDRDGVRLRLDGSLSSDPDGTPLRYRWSGIRFEDRNAERPFATFPAGTTIATLQVEDDRGVVATDTVKVIIRDPQASIRPDGLAANEAFMRTNALSIAALATGEANVATLHAAQYASVADAIGLALGDAYVWSEGESPEDAAADYGGWRLMQSAYGNAAANSLAEAYIATGDPAFAAAYGDARLGTLHALADLSR